MTLSEELAWRGFVNQTTFSDPADLDSQTRTFYFGVDPSADSMQIGNLAAAMMVRHFIDHGHKAILLVGGATGMIGDPDGKKQERDLKTLEEIAKNKTAIAEQYRTVFAGQDFEIVDNYDWFKDINYLDFLRDIGKHVPMRTMLGREFVNERLSEEGAGISYAEFSYSLIQGYDFLHLYRTRGVTLQLSGADQWGNSIAGVDLIRRVAGGEAHVWTAPLIVNKATGVKFGKTEGGAVWLEASKTSPMKFYQFWMNLDDEGVEDYLKIYTLRTKEEIEQIIDEHKRNPGHRYAQRILAHDVTSLIHGQDRAGWAGGATKILTGEMGLEVAPEIEINELKKEIPYAKLSIDTSLVDALVATGLASSRSEARRLIEAKAVYINGESAVSEVLREDFFINNYLLLRRGKAFKDTALIEK